MMRRLLFCALFLASQAFLWTVTPTPATLLCPMGMPLSAMAAAQDPQPPQDPPQTTPAPAPEPAPEPAPSNDDGEGDYVAPPAHVEPTNACTPHPHVVNGVQVPACMCTMNALGMAGCKAGEREVEIQSCNSWCFKKFCHCCRT